MMDRPTDSSRCDSGALGGMGETPEEFDRLQALLDAGAAGAGPQLRASSRRNDDSTVRS